MVRRIVVLVTATVMALAACAPQDYGGSDLDSVGRDIPDKKIEKVRKKIARENKPAKPPVQDGKIVLTVKDQTELPRAFIQVRIRSRSGTTSTTLLTDVKGKARATVTPGTWFAEILPGCQERMNVTFADSRTLEVPSKGTATATLRAEATRRTMPGAPLTWDLAPPWPTDRPVQLRFRWADRCGDGYKAGENFELNVLTTETGRIHVHEHDTESDAQGWVTATVSCNEQPSPGSKVDGIWFTDRFHESDRVNVLALVKQPARGWCA